jgi:tripartite-type tricarboxylate transporter receptor subunit TctC
MSSVTGQQMVVENATGAGGTVGAGKAAQARPDGYTLLLSHIGQATSASLYRKLPYHPVDAFESVAIIAEVPMVVVARKDFPAASAPDLVAYIRASRDKLTYGNGGVGSASHLCGLLLMSSMKAEMTTVSYKGSGPALTDVLGGRIDLLCDQTTTAAPHVKASAVRGYAVTTPARVSSLPDIPTLDEAGLKGFDVAVWYGILAPKGTPGPIVQYLASSLKTAISDPATQKRYADFGAQPITGDRATPAGADRFFRAEVTKWAPIIRAAGVYAD